MRTSQPQPENPRPASTWPINRAVDHDATIAQDAAYRAIVDELAAEAREQYSLLERETLLLHEKIANPDSIQLNLRELGFEPSLYRFEPVVSTGFLWSFLSGLASVFDLSGSTFATTRQCRTLSDDMLALGRDWRVVGNDLRAALDHAARETGLDFTPPPAPPHGDQRRVRIRDIEDDAA